MARPAATPATGGPHRVTIDLDGARCYRLIHGCAQDDESEREGDADPLLLQALPRILDVGERLRARFTLFAVGRDLRAPAIAELVRAAVALGHDVQSHSFAHAYDLSRWQRERVADDVARSLDVIEAVTGVRPRGFRAPGYNLSSTLLDVLVRLGVRWSSSVLPSPIYFAARAAVIVRTRLRGRQSASLLGDPRAFSWPRRRRFLHHTPSGALAELPLTTAAGLPWTGTTLALLPDPAADALTTTALLGTDGDDVVFELHAADFVDGALLPVDQPDARVPLADKQRRIERAIARVIAA